jgi:uncharacterized protein (DUF488 family)
MLNRIYTIGHSTRTLDELVALLGEHGVTRLADVRRYPGSRRHPHFSRESLESALPLDYIHFEDLGGRRTPLKDSRNAAWENPQFRGYADYMCMPEFRAAVDRLLDTEHATAVMCAEAVPWRCHRNLLSDDLVRRGVEVVHIIGPASAQPHKLSAMARIAGDCVTYPPEQSAMF